MTDMEATILTTPHHMTFNNERLLSLLHLVQKVSRQKNIDSKNKLLNFFSGLPELKKYIVDFDYYKSNYSFINHILIEDVVDEVSVILKNPNWKDEYKKLYSYSVNQEKEEHKILKKYKLKSNPLFLFQKMVYWREYRKQINLMGIHLLHYVAMNIEQKTGIPYKYLKHLTIDEIPNVYKGLVSREQLENRYNFGVFVYTTSNGEYHLIEGREAQSLCDEMEKKIRGEGDNKILTGRVACQGYAKGIARIILGISDFSKFNDGEILVTGMTRPEFVPLMKKASAIVTNEGGITCHAAIVSRELGKPCIIGTQRATQLIKDGDLVEVRANHGTVRILS